MSKPKNFEWPFDLWLRYACLRFGLSPAQFWAMSVRDWLALCAPQNGGGLPRSGLQTLMTTYPDEAQNG